ncbi:MAG: 3-deoxy-D-manno-octulosonic acid transferase [Alphaproteobacteria bacterium GM202ARS2]|nr:3-deoxy-D-manno-octulosonic acid transferase [Alphaproteobacteria bacterium GM202ARS2]
MVSANYPKTLLFYRAGWRLLRIAVPLFLHLRLWRGKEEKKRLPERVGRAYQKRPKGKLLWIHAASVGEYLSTLPLLKSLTEQTQAPHILLTTGTVTSARLAQQRNPAGVIHHYICLDAPRYVARFLDHWRPNVSLWMESELWPTMLMETRKRHIPMLLINARMSSRSQANWRRAKKTLRYLLACFDGCFPQNESHVQTFHLMGARSVRFIGNLKDAAEPLPCSAKELATWQQILKGRPIWIAASTHPGEDLWIKKTHSTLQKTYPNLVTLHVPRHASRGRAIAQALRDDHCLPICRSDYPYPPQDEGALFYIADTIGELGLFYRLACVAFIGGSLIQHGGQNPLEAARLDCAIITGPHHDNFQRTYHALNKHGAAQIIRTAEALPKAVLSLLQNKSKRTTMARNAQRYSQQDSQHIVGAYRASILPWL